jgi:hypothetical protein
MYMADRNLDSTVLTDDRLIKFQEYETYITGKSSYTELCMKDYDLYFGYGHNHPEPCRPQDSILQFYFGTELDSDFDEEVGEGPQSDRLAYYGYNGMNDRLGNVTTVTSRLANHKINGHLTKDFPETHWATHMASYTHYGLPLAGYDSPYRDSGDQIKRIRVFHKDDLVDKLVPLRESVTGAYILVDGENVQETIFFNILTDHDLPLFGFSLFCVFCFMTFHMRSMFMAMCAMSGIVLAFFPLLFFYRVICGIPNMSVLTILAFFSDHRDWHG